MVKNEKTQVSLLSDKDRKHHDEFNMVEHKNLELMERKISKLNELILKWGFPRIALTHSAFRGVLNPTDFEVSDYLNITNGTLTTNPAVKNFPYFIELNVQNNYSHNPTEYIITNGNLKRMLYHHNCANAGSNNELTLSRALLLDAKVYSDNYINIIHKFPNSIAVMHKTFIGLCSELEVLNSAYLAYKSGNIENSNSFISFQKRQISYHLYMIENLKLQEKIGLGLNRNYS